MIEKIYITNFKSHAHTEIELGRVTALVGPNGCGKTSLLLATYCLGLLAQQSIDQTFNQELDASHLLRRGTDHFDCEMLGRENETPWRWAVSFVDLFKDAAPFGTTEWKWGTGKLHRDGVEDPSAPKANEDYQKVVQAMGPIAYFKPSFSKLSSPSYSEEVAPQVDRDGGDLASAVAYLILTKPESYLAIEASLQTIIPTMKRIRVRPAKVKRRERKVLSVNDLKVPYDEEHEFIGHELIFDTTSADSIPAHAMSDGTLISLGLLTLLHGPRSPKTILFDDLEQGLHPLAQRVLMTTLKNFAEKHGKQIILTSHSPYIVDELEAKDVWAMATDKEGISYCKRLSDHPDAERALRVLTTGEFLGAEGEEWVVPENAPVEEAYA